MKRLDVHEFHTLLDQTQLILSAQREQYKRIEDAIREFVALGDALTGSGGEAIKSFFRDVHLPYLLYIQSFISDFEDVIQRMRQSLDSLEPTTDGVIRVDYLEHDVERGLERLRNRIIGRTDEVNEIIQRVSDIISLPKLSDAEVLHSINELLLYSRDTVHKLEAFDYQQSHAIQVIDEALDWMMQYISSIETIFSQANMSPLNYSPFQLRNNDAYQTILEKVEHKLIADDMMKITYGINRWIIAYDWLNNHDGLLSKLQSIRDSENAHLVPFLMSSIYMQLYSLINPHFSMRLNDVDIRNRIIEREIATLGWEGMEGGFEHPEVFKANWMINLEKLRLEYAEYMNDTDELNIAKENLRQLREEYAHLPGLITDEENAHFFVPIELEDGNTMHIRIDENGQIYYKADPKYEWYEQIHEQSRFEHMQGRAARFASIFLLTRRASSLANTSGQTSNYVGFGGGLSSEMIDSLINEYRYSENASQPLKTLTQFYYVPEVGEVRAMIYRTDRETGKVENFILVIKNGEVQEVRNWREYN